MTWQENGKTPVLGQLFSPYLEERLGKTRAADEPVGKKHQDIAASMQAVLEEAYFRLLNHLHQTTRQSKVCLAGGVAFNCVANGKIFDHTPFSEVYVQPAAGDAGLSVGAAYYVYHQILGQPRSFVMDHAYWGPQFTPRGHRAGSGKQPGSRFGLPREKAFRRRIGARSPRNTSPTAKSWDGIKAGRSGVRAPWETGAFWWTLAARK